MSNITTAAKMVGPVGTFLGLVGFISSMSYAITTTRKANKERQAGDETWKKDAQFAAFLIFTTILFFVLMIALMVLSAFLQLPSYPM